jgi:RND family efflux transporter MFP subunit
MHKPNPELIARLKKFRPLIALGVVLLVTLIVLLARCPRSTGTIRASGNIEVREIELASRVASRVMRIVAPEGTRVPKDGLVISLDDRLVSAQRASAEALLFNAEDAFKRTKSLYQSGSVPKQQFEQARAMYNKALADLEQAQLMAEESSVSAPWEGTVLRLHVEEGELVPAMSPLATFGDIEHVKIRIYVSTRELGLVKQGQKAVVTVDAFPKRKFPGTVTVIAEKAEFTPKTIQTKDERVKQVFSVEVQADNPEGLLKPGMPADVEIFSRGSEGAEKR